MSAKNKLIDPLEFRSAIKDLNRDTEKSLDFAQTLSEPPEDSDGSFHRLIENTLETAKGNFEWRSKFGEYLLSKDFQNDLYREVGNFLGYSNKDISKKRIRKTISDKVIASTFQRNFLSSKERTEIENDFKYLTFASNHCFYNIWPAEKKGKNSGCYVKNNKIYFQDVYTRLEEGKKLDFKESINKGKPGYAGELNFKERRLISHHNRGKTLNDNFHQHEPLSDGRQSNIKNWQFDKFFLESKKIVCGEISDRLFKKKSYYSKELELKNQSIGKNSFKIELSHNDKPNKVSYVAFELISRPITSKDLILDAEWVKVDDRRKQQLLRNNGYKPEFKLFLQRVKETKNIWDFHFLNTPANRMRLHKFFLKYNFKKVHWGYRNYQNTWGSDFLVSGDFIVNIGRFYRGLSFPIEQFSHAKFSMVEEEKTISDVVEKLIVKKIRLLNHEYLVTHKEYFEINLGIFKYYEKPVDPNESITLLKSILESVKLQLRRNAADLQTVSGNLDLAKKLDNTGAKELINPPAWDMSSDPFKMGKTRKLQLRVWDIMHKHLYFGRDSKPLGLGALSSQRLMEETFEEIEAQDQLINHTLNQIEDILRLKKVRELKEINNWLAAEQIHFSQSYFKDFERHPQATSLKHNKVLEKYIKMDKEKVIRQFGYAYDRFTEDDYAGNESPKKIMHSCFKKEIALTNKARAFARKKYKDLPLEPSWKMPDLNSSFLFGTAKLSRHHLSETEYVKKYIEYNKPSIRNKAGFPSGRNQLVRYTTQSYDNFGEELENLKVQYDAAVKNNVSVDNLIVEMRRWLAEEEYNFINAASGSRHEARMKYRKTKEYKTWFYYPNYIKSHARQFFNLKEMFKAWDQKLIDAIIQMLLLIRSDDGLTFFFREEIQKRKVEIEEELSVEGSKHKKYRKKEYLCLILDKIFNYVDMQSALNINKSFYGVGDSILRIILFLEGLNPYAGGKDWEAIFYEAIEGWNSTGQTAGFKENISYKANIDRWALEDIFSIVNFYQKVFKDLIEHYDWTNVVKEDSELELKISELYYTKNNFSIILHCWETLNHLKAIKKYVRLICKYDLFDLREREDDVIQYISKEDANFLIRKKSKAQKSIRNLEDAENYLEVNKHPNYKNKDKYRELSKLIKKEPLIKKYKIRGEEYIERKGFVQWLRSRVGYRGLEYFKFSNFVESHLEMETLVKIENNLFA